MGVATGATTLNKAYLYLILGLLLSTLVDMIFFLYVYPDAFISNVIIGVVIISVVFVLFVLGQKRR